MPRQAPHGGSAKDAAGRAELGHPLNNAYEDVLLEIGLGQRTECGIEVADKQIVGLKAAVTVVIGIRSGTRLFAPSLVQEHRTLGEIVRKDSPCALGRVCQP